MKVSKLFSWFKKKPIIIPLTTNGKENGTWIECYKNDLVYKQLVTLYGDPLPATIETVPVEEN